MYNLLFVFVLFASAVEGKIPGINYWDEGMLLLVPAVILMVRAFYVQPSSFRQIWIPAVLLIAGIAGNLLHPGIQDAKIAVIKDIAAFLKFPVIMLLLQNVPDGKRAEKRVHEAAGIAKIIVLGTCACAIMGYAVNLGFYTDEVRLVRCFRFVFSHPTFMVSTYAMIICVLMADSITRNVPYILGGCFVIFLGQRTKGFLVILLALAALFIKPHTVVRFFGTVRRTFKIKPRYLVLLSIAFIVLGWVVGKQKIDLYFGYGLTATRPALYIVGLYIASAFFPFGSGFGTFASVISGDYYSNIYEAYGIENVLGMTRNAHPYIGDTFWPYIYGQFGFAAVLLYGKMLFGMITFQLRKIRQYNKVLAMLIIWMYAIFASTAEAYFTNSTGVQMAFILSLYIGTGGDGVRIDSGTVGEAEKSLQDLA